MAAACLPSKTESTSPKDSSLFSEQTQDFQNSALLSLNHRAQTELVSDTKIWGFFQHFRNMKAWNTPRANCSGFGKWGTWPRLWQFTKPECGEANLQDLGRSCTPVPASATHSPSQLSRQSRCCARDSWSPQKWCPAERGHSLSAQTPVAAAPTRRS